MSWEFELTNMYFQTIFGVNYATPLSLIISSIIAGFIFFTFHFVINRKNPEIWRNVNLIEKIAISFIFGIGLFLISDMITLVFFLFLGKFFSIDYLLYLFVIFYSAFLLVMRPRNRNPLEDIKDYFIGLWNSYFLLLCLLIIIYSFIHGNYYYIILIIISAWLLFKSKIIFNYKSCEKYRKLKLLKKKY